MTSSASCDYDIISLTETWIDQTNNNSEFISNQYSVFRKDRADSAIKERLGGGVLLAVRSEIKCEEYTNDDMKDIEAVCVRIPVASTFLYIFCLYIQCKGSIELYRMHLKAIESLRNNSNIDDTIIVLGDFNLSSAVSWESNDLGFDFIPTVHNSKSKTVAAKEVTSTLMNIGLFQMTDVENKFGNVLDLVYTDSPELIVVNKDDFFLLPPDKCDDAHVPLVCTIECCPTLLPSGNSSEIFCFKKANYEHIREHLLGMDFSNIFAQSNEDVNAMTERLYDVLYDTFERFVPKATVRSTNKPVWYNKNLAHLKNIRNKKYKKLCTERVQIPMIVNF